MSVTRQQLALRKKPMTGRKHPAIHMKWIQLTNGHILLLVRLVLSVLLDVEFS